jgi:hypothetical protein
MMIVDRHYRHPHSRRGRIIMGNTRRLRSFHAAKYEDVRGGAVQY